MIFNILIACVLNEQKKLLVNFYFNLGADFILSMKVKSLIKSVCQRWDQVLELDIAGDMTNQSRLYT